MCKLVLINALLFCSTVSFAQRNHYVNSSYDFSNGPSNGMELTPWTTLTEVNANAHQGDVVYFHRGETFYGTLTPGYNKIEFRDYGDAGLPNPKISGFTILDPAEFSHYAGRIYKKPLAKRPKVLVMNRALVEIGRTPNSTAANGGYYTYYLPVGTDYITAANGSEITGIDATDVVIRTRDASIEAKPLTSIDGGNLRVYFGTVPQLNGATASFSPQETYGYYFQNGLNTLDAEGEWCVGAFEEGNETSFLYMSLVNPATAPLIYVSTTDILCNLGLHDDITIRNIDFEGADRMAIDAGDNSDTGTPENIQVINCNFRYIGVRAIHARHVAYLTVEHCTFRDCISGAVQFYAPSPRNYQPYNKIVDCEFTNIAPYPGMAWNNDVSDDCAISDFVGYGSTIANNTFDGIGKSAIHFQGDEVGIVGNKIANAMLNFADYGAIYTYTLSTEFDKRLIEDNLIHDCPGNIYGTTLNKIIANGIYLDGITMNVDVKRNTIYNMGSSGITSNNPYGILLEENTLYNNIYGIKYTHKMYERSGPIDIKIIGNKIYSLRGQIQSPSLIPSGTSLCAAISFESGNPDWSYDLQNTHCYDNAYGLTNPLAFNISVPPGPEQPSNWIGLPRWTQLADENNTQTFPAREHFMPDGQAYVIKSGASYGNYYTLLSNPLPTEWSTTDPTVSYSWVNAERVITMGTASANNWVRFTRALAPLQAGKKYLFRYTIKAGAGSNGICRSYIRTSGTSATFYTTQDNFRTYTDQPQTVEFILVPGTSVSAPVFCIDLDKSWGIVTYISNIEIREYDAADIAVENATDFVQFACNGDWFQNYLYTPLPVWAKVVDGFGFETDDAFELNTYQSMLLFTMGLVDARPYNVKAPIRLEEISAGLKKNVSVYPNPATDAITIGTLNAADKWEKIEIFNTGGRLMKSREIIKGQTTIQLFVESLAKGFYIISLKKKNGEQLGLKFIKN